MRRKSSISWSGLVSVSNWADINQMAGSVASRSVKSSWSLKVHGWLAVIWVMFALTVALGKRVLRSGISWSWTVQGSAGVES